jgi:putative NIF3 family GTP cyclohydrolase 1 type 2
MIRPPRTGYQLAQRQQAVACGGLGMITELIRKTDLRRQINRAVPIFQLHAPYDEADHVLNIALNLLTGGTCLDHLELRRNDESYLDALDAPRIPDPTTAGDFCRRFDEFKTLLLMQAINRSRRTVWKQQDDAFFAQATIEADGTMVETHGEKKQGIGMNHKGQWGYHPLVVTLAETREVLYLANRSGNRPSHEDAAFYFDLAIDECRQAGFRKIVLRGDTDFALTENFDRWDQSGVEFVFGLDAMPNLVAKAESLENSAWTPLHRRRRTTTEPRAKRPNHKQAFVEAKGYRNLKLRGESYAEFDYRPTKCSQTYRVVAVRKRIDVEQGQQRLFEEVRYFFYITNAPRSRLPARRVIAGANQRCDQENTISQLQACHALAAPLDNLVSNWAYMVIASLAWTLKVWSGLMIRPGGRNPQRVEQASARRCVLRMEFATFLNAFIHIPAQVIRSSRRLIYRLLSYRPSVDVLLLMHQQIVRPLRC